MNHSVKEVDVWCPIGGCSDGISMKQVLVKFEESIMAEEDKQRKVGELQAHAVAGDSAAQAARDKLAAGWLLFLIWSFVKASQAHSKDYDQFSRQAVN